MGIHKELQHALVELAKQQKQVYPDAADFSIPVSGPKDPVCIRIADLFQNELYAFKGLKQERVDNATQHSVSVSIKFNIPWECVDGDSTKLHCSNWHITYWKGSTEKIGVVTLTTKNTVVPVSDVWEAYST